MNMDRQQSQNEVSENTTDRPESASVKGNGPAEIDWRKLYHGEFGLDRIITVSDIQESWKQFNEKTKQQWQRFTTGADDIDTGIVPQDVVDGWRRCREKRLDPFKKPRHPELTGKALSKLLDDNQLFIDTSQPFLNRLYQHMKTTSFIMSLFDKNGFLLRILQDEKFAETSRRNQWAPGAQWTEAYGGNNSVGSVITLKRPLQIVGPQHYLQSSHFLATSGAPIFSPTGELLGGVSLLVLLYGSHPHTLGMAIAAAHAIENEMRTQIALAERNAAYDETDVMASLQQSIATYIPDALLALNNEGRIYAINEKAKAMLGLAHEDCIGQRLHDLPVGLYNQTLCNIIDGREALTDMEISLQTVSGRAEYSLTCKSVTSAAGAVIGKILIISEIKRIKSLVTKFIGAKANLHFEDIHCRNASFRKMLDRARLVSEGTSNVLILGESGTGKDIMAQAIHNASARRGGPYIAINCGAIPRDLIASELFGHSEGAFTGSRKGGNQGKFELADGGTIFLDEIAETPLDLQAVLLRVIEDKCVVRVGGNQIREVDVRIISATNKNLIDEVNKGNFRNDLYYRLNVFDISLPPLRERIDDIPLLVDLFMKKYASALNKMVVSVDENVWDVFLSYSWPGNVRELQNVVERMVNYATSTRLSVDLIPPEIVGLPQSSYRKIDVESPAEKERRLIGHLLSLKITKTKIAHQLNMSRATLYRKMAEYGFKDMNPSHNASAPPTGNQR